jgi:hypothetical protein
MESLQTLHVRYFGEEADLNHVIFSQVLSKTETLTKLEFTFGNWGKNGIALLAQGLRCNASVTSLSIEQCRNVENQGVKVLFEKGLTHNTTLTQLTLKFCGIDDDGVRMMIQHWPVQSPIQSLCLAKNRMGPIGALLLLRTIRHHPSLDSLDLSNNHHIQFEGLLMDAVICGAFIWISSLIWHKHKRGPGSEQNMPF